MELGFVCLATCCILACIALLHATTLMHYCQLQAERCRVAAAASRKATWAVNISTKLLVITHTRCCPQHGCECIKCRLAHWLSLPAMVLMGSLLAQAAGCGAAQPSA